MTGLYASRLLPLWARGDRRDSQLPPGQLLTRTVSQEGAWARVTCTTNLTGPVYWHWWEDGRYVGSTPDGVRLLHAPARGQLNLRVRPVRWRSYDGRRVAVPAYDGRVTVEWLRSPGGQVERYLVQARPAGGDWQTLAKVRATGAWSQRCVTPPLADDTVYELRVVVVARDGSQGVALNLGSFHNVRYPDQVAPDISWDPATGRFTFAEAT
ncbi:MAG: hypothetical protein KBG29_15250 [Pseudomonadales bacterium]|nr:hypothetical protein [Pseudomonadales bacterium]HRS28490.1 hypothetical protein [Phycisphaerae bacterium]HRT42292.1 hypothetical protein [Phycisphaerae bacterium]